MKEFEHVKTVDKSISGRKDSKSRKNVPTLGSEKSWFFYGAVLFDSKG